MQSWKVWEWTWDFSALHAELDVVCPEDDGDVLWCASFVVTSVDAVGVAALTCPKKHEKNRSTSKRACLFRLYFLTRL